MTNNPRRVLFSIVFLVSLILLGCDKGPAQDEAKQAGKTPGDFPEATADYFHDVDGGIELTADEIKGRNTWLIWTGGNEAFWDWLANNSYGTFDLLKTMSSFPCSQEQEDHVRQWERGSGYSQDKKAYYRYYQRDTRFEYLGLMNEPGFVKASKPDAWGLCLDERVAPAEPFDEQVYGRASGIVGLRIYPNPNFDEKAKSNWDPKKFYTDSQYYSDRKLVRPYRVGMACAFCHISHHPLHPPADPAAPEWRNLSATIGAQYFWFGRVFAPNVGPDNFVYHLLGNQQPGSVDTSFVPTDNLNNPRALNAIFNVPARIAAAERWGKEKIGGGALNLPEVQRRGPEFGVPHILWDGADSVGVDAALTRVYINIGEYHQEWVRHFKVLVGGQPQTPIEVKVAQENSVYWNATQERSGNLAKYLIRASGPMYLKDAPGGEAYLQGGRDAGEYEEILTRGKVVFAENCARCHSSKLPNPAPGLDEGPQCGGDSYRKCWDEYWNWTETDEFKTKMREIVLGDDFLQSNYLSTDARIPVDVLETEICSAMASNAVKGHVWDNFVSETYWNLPSVGEVDLYRPIAKLPEDDRTRRLMGNDDIRGRLGSWPVPGGGRGYQRVPSLVAIWSTAPFLHNNEVGKFTNDPSTAGRMAAFDDAIRKLLWPEARDNNVHRVEHEGYIYYGGQREYWKVDRVDLKVATPSLPAFLQPLLDENWLFRLLRRIKGLDWLVADGEVVIGPIPEGTPVNLLANLNVDRSDPRFDVKKLVKVLIAAKHDFKQIHEEKLDDRAAAQRLSRLVPDLIDLSACPDFVADRGHYFGAELPDEDKEALVEFVKTL